MFTGQMASFLPWKQNQPNGGRDENFVTVALKHFQDENKVNEIKICNTYWCNWLLLFFLHRSRIVWEVFICTLGLLESESKLVPLV